MIETFTSNTNWTCPAGVTSVQIECFGKGGSVSVNSTGVIGNGGAGGGAYSKTNAFVSTPTSVYAIVVNDGTGYSKFNATTCKAQDGTSLSQTTYGGQGGLAANGVGDVKYSGGNGGNGYNSGNTYPGGGGSSAGTAGAGNNGTNGSSNVNGVGGTAPTGGAAGGDAYNNGNAYGGGAGGGASAYYTYSGGQGKVVLTYTLGATVLTTIPTNVASTTVTGNGNITDTGGANITRKGICYVAGTSGDPTTADSVVFEDGSFGVGTYSESITGLSAATGYRLRAYTVNPWGTTYGITYQITTAAANTPSLTTQAPTSITTTTMTANGNITATGGSNATRRGFVYMQGTSGDPVLTSFNPELVSSYSETNQNTAKGVGWVASTLIKCGSLFTSTVNKNLNSAVFYLGKQGTISGPIYAELYATSGLVPTGSALAISDVVDSATIINSYGLITFNFTGANKYTLSASTQYAIVVSFSGGSNGNYLLVGAKSPVTGGKEVEYNSPTWFNATTYNICYYVYVDSTTGTPEVHEDGSFGTGAYTKGITGLTAGTPYRIRSYATNPGGTNYGDTVQVGTVSVSAGSAFQFFN